MATPSPTLPTVVLVHGAWADGSSWRLVVPYLMQQGIAVVAVQNPTTSLAADVEATKLVLDAIEGPIVLVGHSWGGAVIAQAGNDPKVKALVFVAALPPKAGESVGDLIGSHPPPPGLGQIVKAGPGLLKLSPEGWINDVAQDLPEADARVLAVVQPPLPESTFGDKITEAAWATRPNWYIVSVDDRVVSVDLQRELASRLKATTSELKASHLSILSQPQAVADVIISAVTAAKSAQ
ncbi:alpha/beta fold hydrolase [Rhodopseudomonas palustris]|uniref:Alpha/beta hydrolase n=1 Tax=Rhodopseudomonas palustris TaxID=1076 RepID=A0A418VD88_RHOPL|nr:alpha/beta hydrolase [Rhodopseudomonas palustris]RJF73992.1 alpha/beta hydrolase [Rhodopseudomonas palustris]